MITLSTLLNPFQPSIAFNIETSHLICIANSVNVFFMNRNTVLEYVKDAHNLQHSSCQNKNISFASYFYSYKVYIFEKGNTFPF